MTAPVSGPASSPPSGPVSIPPPVEREPRRKMMLFDRLRLLIIIGVIFTLTTMYKGQQVPLYSFGDAVRDQFRAKWWLVALFGLEVLHQMSILIAERSTGWQHFVSERLFGGWDRLLSRMNPWLRYRLRRVIKWVLFLAVMAFIGSWKWGITYFETIAQAPGRIFANLFVHPIVGLPFALTLLMTALYGMFNLVIFFGIFFVGGVEVFKPGEIKTRFSDVWGQDHVIAKVRENLDLLNFPEKIEKHGGYVPSGLLLWGPPGTGKTMMAEAMAGETGKPFFFVDPSAFVQTFIGVAPMKIKWLYRRLRKTALKHGGVVVFFDEADVLGNRGNLPENFRPNRFSGTDDLADLERHVRWLSPYSQRAVLEAMRPERSEPAPKRRFINRIIMGGMGMGGGGMGSLQALLTEMSGLAKPRGFWSRRLRNLLNMPMKQPPKYRILHVFATNQPNALDQALLRPGRIDRSYRVGRPSKSGRIKTYQGYLNKIRHDVSPEQVEKLATITPGATGASIKDLVNEAVIHTLRNDSETVTFVDMLRVKREKDLGLPEDVDYIERERHSIAVHEACHALAAYRFRGHMMIDTVSIEKAENFLGVVASSEDEERYTRWKSEYEADIKVSLASLAGEKMFFEDDNSSGVSGDLMSASIVSTLMESTWGMGKTVMSIAGIKMIMDASVAAADAESVGPPSGMGGDPMKLMAIRVEARLEDLRDQVASQLITDRTMVLAIAHAVETYKTISGEDVAAIMQGTVGPVVDGRPYHLAAFTPMIEKYHAAAVVAHQHHAKLEEPLPVFGPPRGFPPPPPVA